MQKKKRTRRKPVARKTRRRRRRKKSKGLLSELVTERTAQSGIRTVGSGALGGGAANLLQGVLKDDMPTNMKIFWTAVGAFGAATVGKMPTVGAGMAGVAGYQLLTEVGGMAEGEDVDEAEQYMYAAQTEDLPDVLDEFGRPMTLAEDGNLYLAEDLDLAEDEYEVYDHDGYQVPYAPDFGQY